MKVGVCKLCLETKPLLKKSHIIPEFMYQNVYIKGEQIEIYSPRKVAMGEPQTTKKVFTGAYDQNILCRNCDNGIIGLYETYASKIMYGKDGKLSSELTPLLRHFGDEGGQTLGAYSNIDYAKYKLFLLSILWRASVSKHFIFDQVNLGPHQETIREMIYSGDPKEVFDYPIIQCYFNDRLLPSIIGQPRRVRTKPIGLTVYHFIIDKSIFAFTISDSYHRAPAYVHNFSINKENEMKVPYLQGERGRKILFSHFNIDI